LKSEIKRLEGRLERIGGQGWIPGWLKAVGNREELAEWRSIRTAYQGLDRVDRIERFVKEMRAKHPDMPPSFEEQLQAEVQKLKEDPELRRREALEDGA
jgi:uncharacterized short protein YbdD (DUF466 family)